MKNGLLHGWLLSILQTVVGGVVLAILTLAVLPAINGFFGDWKKSWVQYVQQKGHRLRLLWKIYRLKRRTRRDALILTLHESPTDLIRYLAYPIFLSFLLLIGALPLHGHYPGGNSETPKWFRYFNYYQDFYQLFVCIVWGWCLITIQQSGSVGYLKRRTNKTRELLKECKVFAGVNDEPVKKTATLESGGKNEGITNHEDAKT